jgi:hypothetical protein
MRTLGLNVLLLIVFVTAAATPSRGADFSTSSTFISWALDRSTECDARWKLITDSGPAESSVLDGTQVFPITWLSSGERGMIPGALSHSVITTTTFIHEMSKNERYFPLTTRLRDSPARGASTLDSPSRAELAVPYEIKRPLNSSLQQKNFFPDYGCSISRPKLTTFGRISHDHRLYDGSTARPAFRADRPKIL